jgi:hypothetical protein
MVNPMTSLILSLLVAVLAIASPVANFSGKWVIEAQGRSPGQPVTTLILNQIGNQVTGSISSRTDAFSASPVNTEILDGVVENDTVTFYVWTGLDRPVKTFYKGTFSGDEIKFTVTGGVAGTSGLSVEAIGGAKGSALVVLAKRAR